MPLERNITRYGADETGLISGYAFAPGQPPQPLSSENLVAELQALRARPAGDPHFFWLHFNLAHATAERWLERHAKLSPGFYDALRDELRSTRIERDEEALVAVVNDVRFDFAFAPSDLSTLWVSLDRQLVVTARHTPLRSIDKLTRAVKNGEMLRSTLELLERLLRAQADVLVDIVREVTRQVDRVEDDLLAGRLDAKRARLGASRRLLVRLQRLLAPEPAALLRLLQHPPAWVDAGDAQQLREAAEEFSVALRDMAALQERIKLLQEELVAMVDERTSRSVFVLTVVTVLALPINILAGLFGMNVGGVPLAQHPHGFWVVTALVVTFTLVAGWFAFRKRKGED
ncbi:transporter [Ramlibacter sp. G-1-2-2]|uniref:Transporter n=1 Tax=Ramlibacter agri TaxID=2728837 RepID=A0A848H1A1_9BURK|nr:transporter [Ramlibacter agri]NML42900.1 transporter [Ramlibacter agri]